MWRKKNTCALLMEMHGNIWRFLKILNINTELPYDPGVPLLGISKKLKLDRKQVSALPCSLQQHQQWPRCINNCPSMDEWIHTQMEYYSVIRKKKIFPLVTIWMELEDTVLSEIGQTKKRILHDIT